MFVSDSISVAQKGGRISYGRQSIVTKSIAVVGLGYVGLPVAVAFARKFNVIGFDVSSSRIEELRRGFDRTGEVASSEILNSRGLTFSTDPEDLRGADDFIVCVPTPIDAGRRPDLEALRNASRHVGRVLRPGCLVVFESTVYPGVTEDVCVPILEKESSLSLNVDFWVGYSPERINPGDPHHRFENTPKVVSGSSEEGLDRTERIYTAVLTAPVHRAPSIRVAEAAKVIENTQRDLNIALINELAMIFERLNIDTQAVLAAAQTKWNFLPFQPGLVGGHCIGVDPYYLTHRAQEVGIEPEVILAGRDVNDSMGKYVANRVIALMEVMPPGNNSRCVLIMGATFKENCPDVRNSKVEEVIQELLDRGFDVSVVDPLVSEVDRDDFGPVKWPSLSDVFPNSGGHSLQSFDAIVLAVAHEVFGEIQSRIREPLRPGGVVFDVKGKLPADLVDSRL